MGNAKPLKIYKGLYNIYLSSSRCGTTSCYPQEGDRFSRARPPPGEIMHRQRKGGGGKIVDKCISRNALFFAARLWYDYIIMKGVPLRTGVIVLAEGFTFVVEKTCPVCGQKTRVVKTRSRLIAEKTDIDFCTHYKGFNPYLYTIWVCEHCGFAADEKGFAAPMSERHRQKLYAFVSRKRVGFKFMETRGVPEAVAAYMLAIHFAEMTDASLAQRAGLFLKLAWVNRLAGDGTKEHSFLRKAAELYGQSVMKERYPIGPMTDAMASYLVGAIYFELGEVDQATQYLGRLVTDQNLRTTEPQVYERARSLWTDIRSEGGLK